MSRKNNIIRGTFILTGAGLFSRLLGFFYRIFMSRTFSAEDIGLYQLIFPVYALGISLCVSGIQTALSRTIAAKRALGKSGEVHGSFLASAGICLSLSAAMAYIVQSKAVWIAENFLGDGRCAPLLTILALAFPFSAMHSIVCGYWFGRKKTALPAASQLVEQVVRIGSVFLLFYLGFHRTLEEPVCVAAAGLVAGEAAAALVVLASLKRNPAGPVPLSCILREVPPLLRLSIPLTASRVLLNILQSVEAAAIPLMLKRSGLSAGQALASYGVLTGMALPCILFPSALTSSLSTVLLPEVADLQASGRTEPLQRLVRKIISRCAVMGALCGAAFFLTGRRIGVWVFQSEEAGSFLTVLAFLCPLLYTGSTFGSILTGLGRTSLTLLLNALSLFLRIASVFLLIPRFGILGYLWGLLLSQLFYLTAGYAVLTSVLKTVNKKYGAPI